MYQVNVKFLPSLKIQPHWKPQQAVSIASWSSRVRWLWSALTSAPTQYNSHLRVLPIFCTRMIALDNSAHLAHISQFLFPLKHCNGMSSLTETTPIIWYTKRTKRDNNFTIILLYYNITISMPIYKTVSTTIFIGLCILKILLLFS